MKKITVITTLLAVSSMAIAATPFSVTEDFNAFTVGQPVGNDADWWGGPPVNATDGVAATQGINNQHAPFYWTANPFDWSDSDFVSFTGGMDFSTDGNGNFDDDRVGFYYGALGTSSSNVMSVQMDPGGSGLNIEGYWDGVGGADKRPSLVNLTGLTSPNTYYRLTATYTKTAISNEPIISVDLQGLDASGNPTGSIASATLDTATLPAGDRPHTKYFSGTVYPAYKNYNSGFADNALAEVVPEPATMSLLGLGALALIRRKRKA